MHDTSRCGYVHTIVLFCNGCSRFDGPVKAGSGALLFTSPMTGQGLGIGAGFASPMGAGAWPQ